MNWEIEKCQNEKNKLTRKPVSQAFSQVGEEAATTPALRIIKSAPIMIAKKAPVICPNDCISIS